MALGSGDAALVDLLLQLEDQVAVLRVHRDDRSQCQRRGEAVHQRFVIAHDGVLVRHEMLEAVDAVLAHQAHHVLAHALVPPGDGNMERVVRNGLLRPFAPLPPRVHDPLLRIRDHEVDDHRGAAGETGSSAGIEIVARHGSHERQLHVGVRVDSTRHDELAARIDDLAARGRGKPCADVNDLAIRAQDVGAVGLIRRHDGAALDENRHVDYLCRWCAAAARYASLATDCAIAPLRLLRLARPRLARK